MGAFGIRKQSLDLRLLRQLLRVAGVRIHSFWSFFNDVYEKRTFPKRVSVSVVSGK